MARGHPWKPAPRRARGGGGGPPAEGGPADRLRPERRPDL